MGIHAHARATRFEALELIRQGVRRCFDGFAKDIDDRRVESEVERNGKIERETRYYVCSVALSAEMFGRSCAGIGDRKPPALGPGCCLL